MHQTINHIDHTLRKLQDEYGMRRTDAVILVAKWADTTKATVYRWLRPSNSRSGGCDGHIPRWHHRNIVIGARAEGYDLAPSDVGSMGEFT